MDIHERHSLIQSTDIKALTIEQPDVVNDLGPAFEKYNEGQFATVKLPGGSQQVHNLPRDIGLVRSMLIGIGHC